MEPNAEASTSSTYPTRHTGEVCRRYSVDRKPMINNYAQAKRIGKGMHGEVWLYHDLLAERQPVAIKILKRKNAKIDKMSLLRRRNLPASPHVALTDRIGTTEHKIRKEIAIMKKCDHEHIVPLYEVIDDKLDEHIYMVMEFLEGGEVKWERDGSPLLRVDESRRICRDVILGLEYLHYQGIIHRDIKPSNLLWTADRTSVKIADFGVSSFSSKQRDAASSDDNIDPLLLDESDLFRTAGTPPFLAPEVVTLGDTPLPQGPDAPIIPRLLATKASDVWALGICLYCFLFGKHPFSEPGITEYQLYELIGSKDWSVPETMGADLIPTGGRYPSDPSTEGYVVVKLLDRLLQKSALKRIILDQLKRHPWFLKDIENKEKWLRETSPNKSEPVTINDSDTNTALSFVRFKWNWRKPLSLLFPKKPHHHTNQADRGVESFGIKSVPNMRLRSYNGSS